MNRTWSDLARRIQRTGPSLDAGAVGGAGADLNFGIARAPSMAIDGVGLLAVSGLLGDIVANKLRGMWQRTPMLLHDALPHHLWWKVCPHAGIADEDPGVILLQGLRLCRDAVLSQLERGGIGTVREAPNAQHAVCIGAWCGGNNKLRQVLTIHCDRSPGDDRFWRDAD